MWKITNPMPICGTVFLFAWSTRNSILSSYLWVDPTLHKQPLINFVLIQFTAIPEWSLSVVLSVYFATLKRVVKSNFGERAIIILVCYFGVWKTFCCYSCYCLSLLDKTDNWKPGTLKTIFTFVNTWFKIFNFLNLWVDLTCTMVNKKQSITFECDISHIVLVVG